MTYQHLSEKKYETILRNEVQAVEKIKHQVIKSMK